MTSLIRATPIPTKSNKRPKRRKRKKIEKAGRERKKRRRRKRRNVGIRPIRTIQKTMTIVMMKTGNGRSLDDDREVSGANLNLVDDLEAIVAILKMTKRRERKR